MAISSVGSAGQSQGASRASFDVKQKKENETIVDQENKENNRMKPGIDNQDLDEFKGVQEVDAKA